MKGKRTISVAMAAIVVSGLLSSCGQSQEEKTGDEKEQVTLQYWYQGTDQLSTEFAQRCVESFNEKYPDIKVEVLSEPDLRSLFFRLLPEPLSGMQSHLSL